MYGTHESICFEKLPKSIVVLYLHTPLQYAVIYYTRNIPRKILVLLTLFLVIRFHTPPQYAVYYRICSIVIFEHIDVNRQMI